LSVKDTLSGPPFISIGSTAGPAETAFALGH